MEEAPLSHAEAGRRRATALGGWAAPDRGEAPLGAGYGAVRGEMQMQRRKAERMSAGGPLDKVGGVKENQENRKRRDKRQKTKRKGNIKRRREIK